MFTYLLTYLLSAGVARVSPLLACFSNSSHHSLLVGFTDSVTDFSMNFAHHQFLF